MQFAYFCTSSTTIAMTLSTTLFLATLVSSSYGVLIPGPQEAVYQTPSGQYVVDQPAILPYGTDSVVSSTSITVDQVVQDAPSSYAAPAPAYLQQQVAPVDVYPAPPPAPYGAPPPPVQVAPIADIPPSQTPSYQAPVPSVLDYIPTPTTPQQQPAIIPPSPGPNPTPSPCTEDAPGPYQTAAPEIRGYTPPTVTSVVQETITSQTQVIDQGPIPGGLYGASSIETLAPSIYANGANAYAYGAAMTSAMVMVLVL